MRLRISNRRAPGLYAEAVDPAKGDVLTAQVTDEAGTDLGRIHYRAVRIPGGGTSYGWYADRTRAPRTKVEAAALLAEQNRSAR